MNKTLYAALVVFAVGSNVVQAGDDPRFLVPRIGVGDPSSVIQKTLEEVSVTACGHSLPATVLDIGPAQSLACSVEMKDGPMLVHALSNGLSNEAGKKRAVLAFQAKGNMSRTDVDDVRSDLQKQCAQAGGVPVPLETGTSGESCRLGNFWRWSWSVEAHGTDWMLESDWY